MIDESYYQPALLILIGAILVVVIKGRGERKKKILSNCIEVQGTVIDQVLEYTGTINNGGSGLYYPVIAFELKDGTPVSGKYTSGYSPAKYTTNQEVTIQYSVEDPHEFLIKGENTKVLETGFTIVGIGMLLYGLFSIYQVYTNIQPH
jgi:hypothetical protein